MATSTDPDQVLNSLIFDLENIVGERWRWPLDILSIILYKPIWKYLDRFKVATFCFVNGCCLDAIMPYVHHTKQITKHDSLDHFKSLFAVFEEGGSYYTNRYYAFNVTMDRYEYLDGRAVNPLLRAEGTQNTVFVVNFEPEILFFTFF